MFQIKRIADERLAQRVCASFGVEQAGAFAYAAYRDSEVLATAAFLTETGGCVTLLGVDTGRRTDVDLVDGLARAAFSAQRKAGAVSARLSDRLPVSLRQALSKRGYAVAGAFALADFFARKNSCGASAPR